MSTEERKYKEWKERFESGRRKDGKRLVISVLVGCLITGILVSGIYLWFKGDLKFVGQRTDYTTAFIVNTYFHHIGNGHYMQTAVYEFEYDGQIYNGSFEAGTRLGVQNEGDSIRVKFSVSHPERSRLYEIYRTHGNGLLN